MQLSINNRASGYTKPSSYQAIQCKCITGTLVGTHSVDASTNPVIDLTDLQDSSIEYGKDFWVKIGSISLHQSHRRVILTGEWLWGTHLTAVQILLKQQFLILMV